MFDILASMVQYEHHLKPIWEALPEDERGLYSTSHHKQLHREGILIVAAIGDYKKMCRHTRTTTMAGHVSKYEPRRRMVLFEHGAGFSFHGDPKTDRRNGSYAGGLGRDKAVMLPAVNQYVSDHNLARYPHIPSPVVGCPKLDALSKLPKPANSRPVVCASFHWDCRVAPETRWAFSWYGAALRDIKDHPDFELVAHGHPRMHPFWRKWYKAQGIEYIDSFDEVCRRVDVYMNDSSSTLYEFAALDRPVVVLNAPWYRRNVHHGLRFWEHSKVGIQCDLPRDLPDAVQAALVDSTAQQKARRAAVAAVYPYLGHSTERTLEVLHSIS